MTDEIKERIEDNDSPITSETYTNMIQLMVPLDISKEYYLGSAWHMEINEKGEIYIKK
ncbi:hypothetical protein [Ferroplasma sp.]|uniref:hypothetical protein n=1 Tax=Ferroplasma sp. TaxID=2591003 RepID=UPI00307D920A